MERPYTVEFFRSPENKKWYWRMSSHTKKIVAIGGEGFASKSNAKRAWEAVINKRYFRIAK